MQLLNLIERADNVVYRRALDIVDLKVHPDGWQGRKDVREQDHTIRLERLPGLQGDFNNQF
jgi:hypothetical protein